MDLKSGCLFWPQRDQAGGGGAARVDLVPLERDTTCDVAVIGAGITGALCSFHLAEAGLDVVVVDRREPGCGSTAASTGLLQYEIDTLLTDLIRMIGGTGARGAYQLSLRTIGDFIELAGRLDDDADLLRRPSLYLATSDDDVEVLRREHRERREIGIEVDLLGRDEIRRTWGFDRPAALYSQCAGEVDPYRLTLALHRAGVARGARIIGHTQVEKYQGHDDGVTLVTTKGYRIAAGKVVFATGYETPEFVDRKLCVLHSTYALASQPMRGAALPLWHEQCLIWEHRRPYFYARATADGRALIGGADIDTADPDERDRLIPEKAEELADSFHKLFPRLRITGECCAWAGTFAETKDGLPYIGSLPEFPHGYFALGYGGNGITFSLLAAQILRDLLTGRRHPDAELFRFGR